MSAIIEKETREEIQQPHVDVPTKKRFLWGLGGFADCVVMQGAGAMVTNIYTVGLGVNAALVSMACALPRFLDFFTDPLIGHMSDNTRSRWGRRRPWMLFGLLTSAILGVLLWRPPVAAAGAAPEGFWPLASYCVQNPVFWYLALMMTGLFAVGYASFSITHVAMGYEMSSDYNERTHLFKWLMSAYALAGFLTPWFLPMAMWLEGDRSQEFGGSQGVIPVTVVVGALILLTGLPSVLFCKEKHFEHRHEDKISFFKAARLTFNNRPFWLLVISNFIVKFMMMITGYFFYFIFVYHITLGQKAEGAALQAIFFNSINVANLIAMAPIAFLTERMGKKPSLLLMLVMSAVAYGSCWFSLTNEAGAFVEIGLPGGDKLSLQWPCLITGALIGIFTNTIPMIQNSMIADVCDLDELNSGHRREAFYGAVFVTTDKLAMAVALAFQGFLLVMSGYDAGKITQSLETVKFWLVSLVVTQPAGFLIGLASILFYPLTRKRCHEIREELAARRAAKVS